MKKGNFISLFSVLLMLWYALKVIKFINLGRTTTEWFPIVPVLTCFLGIYFVSQIIGMKKIGYLGTSFTTTIIISYEMQSFNENMISVFIGIILFSLIIINSRNIINITE
ncbi:MAG TPA: hypothetical protein PLS66_02955 [Tepiditoga sp.]|nr:hypothetical protein [Tepiditoga sp.]